MRRIDLAEEGGLNPHLIAAFDIDQLQRDAGVDGDLFSKIAEVDGLISHVVDYLVKIIYINLFS